MQEITLTIISDDPDYLADVFGLDTPISQSGWSAEIEGVGLIRPIKLVRTPGMTGDDIALTIAINLFTGLLLQPAVYKWLKDKFLDKKIQLLTPDTDEVKSNLDELKAAFDEPQIPKLLDIKETSVDDLYAELGLAIPAEGAFGDESPSERGRAIYTSLKGGLRQLICPRLTKKHLEMLDSNQSADIISLVSIVAGLIGGMPSLSVSSTLLAVLAIRIGLRKLCPKLEQLEKDDDEMA